MRIVYFTHSLQSCWNNGNAHFQRGVLRSLQACGHDVTAYEPKDGWSYTNLALDQGETAAARFASSFPTLRVNTYADDDTLAQAVDGADLVIAHEWNSPAVVAKLGRLRRSASFTLLFHDTHHRAVSDPDAIRVFDLSEYDGVLAFGGALARVYERWGWHGRVFVWHEAADTALFHPPARPHDRNGAVWVGNWGDGERSAEIETYLLAPAREAGVALDIHGVRYPAEALTMLSRYGARFLGWAANASVPELFAHYRCTVHVPRRFYSDMLPGIPTIRVFEALACGIPLISAPWDDTEKLFQAGTDHLVARSGDEMTRHMRALSHDSELAASLSAAGLARIVALHSCDIRAAELLNIVTHLRQPAAAA